MVLSFMTDIPMSQQWSIEPEINYIARRTLTTSTDSNVTTTIREKYNCIVVPVFIKFNTSLTDVNVFVAGGPYATYNADPTTSYSSNGPNPPGGNSDLNSSTNSLEFGIAGEGGCSIVLISSFSLDLRAQYYYGLTNLKKNQSKSTLNSFVLLLGLKCQI
jgi:hypothetical protein